MSSNIAQVNGTKRLISLITEGVLSQLHVLTAVLPPPPPYPKAGRVENRWSWTKIGGRELKLLSLVFVDQQQ